MRIKQEQIHKNRIIQFLTNNLESYAKQNENGVEFWLAHDLQCLLVYTDLRNFYRLSSALE